MALMTWGDEFELGFGDIDVQHQRLVGLINALDDAREHGVERTTLALIVEELLRYTKLHFAFEEKLIKRYAVPRSEQHRAEHRFLTAQVRNFSRDFAERGVEITEELMAFLRDWLTFHILKTDRSLVDALRAAGAVSAA
ncbi:MAG: hemerythrin family protein [Austwickia sp.]|jgi:hemerythrin|nr:hemerythrin family protein [Austwickia sp.]MBK8436723.1 hemerythrin family protein [Austwickia sp.]MBK9100353.1 hemerythrin family protein [Austwickia sp.]